MKLGIMQPYFFPYLGHFHLINSVDRWIIFDTPQFIRHGWINRNRILHPTDGWEYIIVPIKKHSRETPISEIQIPENVDWKGRILNQLKHYKKDAPFFSETFNLVQDCLGANDIFLSKLNGIILEKVCGMLDIPFDYVYFSEMGLKINEINSAGDWALEISKALGATEYINPPGGAPLFDQLKFKEAGIRLTIQKYENFIYSCAKYGFVPGLSIIDVFMWNPVSRIKDHINKSFL